MTAETKVMNKKTTELNPHEATAFLNAYPDTQIVDVLFTDTNGILRGKQIPAKGLKKVFTGGMRLPVSIFALDIWGNDVEASGLILETGDADGICLPIAGSLKTMPWLQRPAAQVLMTMTDADGRPFFGDPRQVLAAVLARFEELELTPVVATELEFYLFDATMAANGSPQAPLSPITEQRLAGSQMYGIQELEEFAEIFR